MTPADSIAAAVYQYKVRMDLVGTLIGLGLVGLCALTAWLASRVSFRRPT